MHYYVDRKAEKKDMSSKKYFCFACLHFKFFAEPKKVEIYGFEALCKSEKKVGSNF